jgi:hypothetical protein
MPRRTRKKKASRRPAVAHPNRVAVLVLGMHRSGTSALTRLFSLAGCSLPKTLMGANSSNTAGHWESTPICRFNDRVLESAGTDWSDWSAVNPGWFRSPVVEGFLLEAIDVLNEEFGSAPLFVLKDPRICRLLPFWIEVFKRAGIDPKFAIPLRNPLEVARSLQKRNDFDVEVGQLLWLRHVLDAEYFSRGQRRFFCSFEQVLSAWPQVLETASSSFGFDWPRLSTASAVEIDQFLNPSLRHHDERSEASIAKADASLLAKTFWVLDRWAGDGERKTDFKELDRARASLAESAPIFERIVLSGRKSATEVRALTGVVADLQKHSARAEESYRLQIKQLSEQASSRESEIDTLNKCRIATEESKRQLVQDLAGAQQRLALITQDSKNLRDKLSETESALRQRRLEAEQTSAELANTKTALAESANALASSRAENQSMLIALEQLKAQLKEAEKISTELNASKSALAESANALAASRAENQSMLVALDHLKGQLEEAEQISAELKVSNTALAESETALEASRAENQSMLVALDHLKGQLEEAEQISAELKVSKTALAESKNALEASRAENQSMLSALHHLKGQLEEAEQTRKELSSLKDTAQEEAAKSTDRTQEIATLTAILRQSEDKSTVSEMALNTVLHGLLQLLNKRPSRLLPQRLQIRQRARVLRDSGLFDAVWYLAENEDVARAGVDPLLHYVEFGANENRAPNAFFARRGLCNVFELKHSDPTKQ